MYRIVTITRGTIEFSITPVQESESYKTYSEALKAKEKMQRNNPGMRYFVEAFS